MPTISTRLLISRMTKLEKKLPKALMSPSTRSMMEPEVCVLWKDISSFKQWAATSPRSWLVAVQPTFSPI
ncbi:hypothetical protein D3C75_1295570 [compost metagenome]